MTKLPKVTKQSKIEKDLIFKKFLENYYKNGFRARQF